MKYWVILETDGKSWSAFVPDLPGCIATGQSMEEVQANIEEAVKFHLEGLELEGIEIPRPTTQAIEVKISA
ncbi:MAG: type II toxin-antitoxin system HicB family antitoxin [Chlorobia bacterium]|nr:type II toxin-antitoxin system HicB family antitoxin [Fimbriimonadaceae bacterium]